MPIIRTGYWSGGLSPEERQQKKLIVGEKKESAVGRIDYDTEKTKRRLSFEFANNPYVFAMGMSNEIKNKLDGIDDVIDNLGIDAPLNLLQLRDKYRDDMVKYSDVVDAFEKLANAFDKKDIEGIKRESERLSGYSVVYTPSKSGRISKMSIIGFGETEKNAHSTNIEFLPSPEKGPEGELKITTREKRNLGMGVYFVKGDLKKGEKITFGNGEFEYSGIGEIGWIMKNPNNFNHEYISRESSLYRQPGEFVKDNAGKVYYINPDKSLSAMVNKRWFDMMGGKPENVYELSPWEEENLLRGTVSLPSPVSQYLENQQIEAEAAIPGIGSLFGEWGRRLKGGPKEWIRTVKEVPSAYQAIMRGVKPREMPPRKPLFSPETKWGLGGIEIPKLIEEARERLKGIIPK